MGAMDRTLMQIYPIRRKYCLVFPGNFDKFIFDELQSVYTLYTAYY